MSYLQIYNFDIIAKQVGLPHGFFIGAGAGNSCAVGTNCEVQSDMDKDILNI